MAVEWLNVLVEWCGIGLVPLLLIILIIVVIIRG